MPKSFVGALWPKSPTYLGFGGSQKLGFSGVCSKCGQIGFCSKMWEKVSLELYGQNRQPIWNLGVFKNWGFWDFVLNVGKLGFVLKCGKKFRWSFMAKIANLSGIWGVSKIGVSGILF